MVEEEPAFVVDEEAARAANITPPGVTASFQNRGHILFALNVLKSELLSEMRSEMTKIRSDWQTRKESISPDVVDKISSDVVNKIFARAGTDAQDLVRGVNLKGKFPSKPLPQLEYAVGKERASVPLLQWAFVVTVLSFTLSVPNARAWVGELTYEKLSNNSDVISAASGLSMVLFSVKNSASKDRFQSSVGRLWSLVLRRAMISSIIHASKNVFTGKASSDAEGDETSNIAPAWIVALGSAKDIAATVNDTVDRCEGKEGSHSSTVFDSDAQRRKRRKVYDDSDIHGELKVRAVKDIRANWMRTMNYGRTEVRSHLYLSFLFMTEKILEFQSVEEAASNGYEVVFDAGTGRVEQEVCEASALSGSIWDIPNSDSASAKESRDSLGGGQDGITRAKNMACLEAIRKRFPSLTVTLKYKKKVLLPRNAAETGIDISQRSETIYWPVVEEVHFHSIAVKVFMEVYKVKDASFVLGASKMSLKAVHVVAIGLRGLLRRSLGMELSQIETVALGGVTHEHAGKGDDRVTAMMENGRKDGFKTCRLKENRKKKFEMAWEEYLEAKEEREAEEQRRNESSRSGYTEQIEVEDDYDEDFLD